MVRATSARLVVPSIARRMRSSPASKWVALSANLGYRYYAHNLERFYNCDWIIGGGARTAPAVAEAS